MTAPCISRLDSAIFRAETDVARACLLAEKGCYLARVGQVLEAQSIRQLIRENFGDGRDLGVSVRLMVLEGVLSYFQNLGSDAGDRLMRAKFLSVASGDRELISLTAAWLSHIQYFDSKYDAAIDSARLAISNICPEQWQTYIRIGLLFGDMHLLVENQRASKHWYEMARNAAVRYGDQAAIGAINYNRASLRIFNLRISLALGVSISESETAFADAENRSSINYQLVAGVTSLEHLLASSRISVQVIRRQYAEARHALIEILQGDTVPVSYSYRRVLVSDLILCNAALGNSSAAAEQLNELASTGIKDLPVEDSLILQSTLFEAALVDPSLCVEKLSGVNLNAVRAKFLQQRTDLSNALAAHLDIPEDMKF